MRIKEVNPRGKMFSKIQTKNLSEVKTQNLKELQSSFNQKGQFRTVPGRLTISSVKSLHQCTIRQNTPRNIYPI